MNRRQFFRRAGLATAAVTVVRAVGFPAPRPRPRHLGISIRFVRQYDVRTDRQIQRRDVIYGVGVLRPELAAQIAA